MANLTSLRRSKYFFGALYLFVLIAAGYISYKILAKEVFNYVLWQKLIEDPDHRLKPHENEDINSDGIRSYREAIAFDSSHFNIIFAGDSYTYGYQLTAEQSPPMQFEKVAQEKYVAKKIQVANFGWSSSSPYLSLRLLKDLGGKYNPDLVIFILDITDYKDDYFYQHIIEKKGAYSFIVDYPLLAHFPRKIARATDDYTGWQQTLLGYPDFSTYFVAHQAYEKSLPFFEGTYKNLEAMNQFVTQELGAKFIVILPPRHWQYTDKESPESWEKHNYIPLGPHVLNNFIYFDRKSKEASFPIISLLDDFKNASVYPTTFTKDSHWNSDGAKLAAELIFSRCQQVYCFD